ncbi:RNase adapter RapZ [Leptolyngbya sp. 7M]|uniref:RNase adapter RapZ n=1 Tax=Leptolyngbya sp. 7M TaxID=2812896 RepID=UPI001B8C106C|nr:RNase adapter RapZ [Leptolyngbya sp. 7M]QYO65596.1 RNase adapter RapZ [Leptolyngbya sp. 7M]
METSAPKLIIITGLSGSGVSSATNAFEDLGYFCVDNLPLTILPTFAKLLMPGDEGAPAIERAALVINIRERHFLAEFPAELAKLKKRKLNPTVLFFEASDAILQRRFSETRRPHPADGGIGLLAAIRHEREEMSAIRDLADLIIDTSDHTVHTLRRMILARFGDSGSISPLRVQFVSFGHKFGNPLDLDLMFDVRHLPNPYFEPSLRDLTGEDAPIREFLERFSEVNETIRRFEDLLRYLLPFYRAEGKSYLSIGIGCTGGRHRSVMVANELAKRLGTVEYEISVTHRDMRK